MIGLDAGAAWASAPDGSGRVRAVFSRAVHVELGGELLVIVDAAEPSGPLHLRVDALPTAVAGSAVGVVDARMQLGGSELDLRSVPRWAPPRVDGRACARWVPPVLGDPVCPHRFAGAARSALADQRGLLECVQVLLRRDDYDGVARLLGGRGPGLTPAGDDALAGIVVTLHVFGVDESRLRAAVEHVRSTELALAYLRWAARGQCIAPAHELVAAVATKDDDAAAAAEARLCQHGASSGADLLLGIALALTALSATLKAAGS